MSADELVVTLYREFGCFVLSFDSPQKIGTIVQINPIWGISYTFRLTDQSSSEVWLAQARRAAELAPDRVGTDLEHEYIYKTEVLD